MTRLPKLAFFIPSLRGGGAERVLTSLASHLVGCGFAVDLVAAHGQGAYLRELDPGIRLRDLNAPRVSQALPGLVGYLHRERPVALVASPAHVGAVAVAAKRLANVPTRIVVREANTPSLARPAARGVTGHLAPLASRFTYRLADRIIAVSAGSAADLAEYARVPRDRIEVVPNPIDLEVIAGFAAARLDHPWFGEGEPPVVLAVGRLTTQKDFPTLLRAFAVARAARRLRLVILGEGEQEVRLRALAEELGVDADVDLPGFVSNPFAYMSRASVVALSSAWEGMPNVLLQALACGCPVVSTDCRSGPSEVLAGGAFGRLVPVGDVEGLAAALVATLREPRDGARLQGRAAEFAIDRIACAYLRVMLPEASAARG